MRKILPFCAFLFALLLTSAPSAHGQAQVEQLTASQATVVGWSVDYSVITVTISGACGNCNTSVTLTFDPSEYATRSGITVPAGQTSASFDFYPKLTLTDTPVTITASVNASSKSVNVLAIPNMETFIITPGTLVGGTTDEATATVTLRKALKPNNQTTVQMDCSNGAFNCAGIPIPLGGSGGSKQLDGDVVTNSTPVTATARFGNSITGWQTLEENVIVMPGGQTGQGPCEEDCENRAGHPINVTNGNTWVQQQDYSLPGLGGGISVARMWNSLWQTSTPPETSGTFGHSWRFTFEERLLTLGNGHKKYWRGDGSAWVFQYDSIADAYLLIAPRHEHASLSFDSGTTLFTLTHLDGSKRIFTSAGYLTAVKDRNGNQTTITYDGTNRITQISDAANRTLTFTYPNGTTTQAQSIQDATGVVASYLYDASKRLTKVTWADGSFNTFEYNSSNLLLAVKDTNAVVLESHTYNSTTRKGLTSVRAGGVDSVTVSYPSGSLSRVTDSKSNVTDYNYQPIGTRFFVKAITGSGCASCGGRGNSSSTFDPYANRTSRTDALGRTTTFTYDSEGNVLTQSQVVNGQPLTWTYTYNARGQVLTATDPAGKTTTNTYDANGNLLSTTTPSPDGTAPGSTTSFLYNAQGLLTRVTDPRNNQTNMTYTPPGLLATVTDAMNNVTTYEYDARGNRTAVVDALSQRTEFEYDAMNRLKKITYPDLTTTQFAYDHRGRRTSVTDGNAKVTTYAYDTADRLTSVTDAANNVTSYAYDSENNLTSITDALGRVTSFTYDAFGRVTKTTFPPSTQGGTALEETYTYDAVGNLLSKTDRKGQTINYFYDALNRMTQKTYPDQTGVTYTYDALSRLTEVSDPTGTYEFAYDNLGRLTGTTTDYAFLTQRTFTNAYTYDAASNRVSFTDPENGQTTYGYDALNRLTSLTDFNANTFNFSYDALSRRTQLTRPNGVNTDYAYDSVSRLLSVLHKQGANVVDGATYTVDNAGNRTAKTNHLNTIAETYSYDNIYQLTQVVQDLNGTPTTTESYAYDAVGNRLSTLADSGWTYNNSNQLTARPGVTYTYDNNGNTLTKTDASGTTTYTWDYENRLTQASIPGGSSSQFKYDPLGRRIQKLAASSNVVYLYDGDNHIQLVNGNGAVLTRYAQALALDEPLLMSAGGANDYYQADGLNSITSLSEAGGTLAASYSTDGFGRETSSQGTITNQYRYSGREWDGEVTLYYYRARYYDPELGRFISEDPIGFGGGVGFYKYVLNNPIIFIDPTGLKWIPLGVQADPAINTVVCDGKGGIRPQIGNPGPHAECLRDCMVVHESVHKRDALASNPRICQGAKDGIQIGAPTQEMNASEVRAYDEEIECLIKRLPACAPCNDVIRNEIQTLRKLREHYSRRR